MADMNEIFDSQKLNEEIEKLKKAATKEPNWECIEESEAGSLIIELSSDLQDETEYDDVTSVISAEGVGCEANQYVDQLIENNQQQQNILSTLLSTIDAIIEKNRQCQEQIKGYLQVNESEKKINEVQEKNKVYFYKPFFQDSSGFFPEKNEDTKLKEQRKEMNICIKPSKMFTKEEAKMMEIAVKADVRQRLIKNILAKQHSCEKRLQGQTDKKIKEELQQQIQKHETEILEIMGDNSLKHSGLDDVDNIDWLKISIVDLKGKRSVEACKAFWRNAGHPMVNTGKWNAEEDRKLASLVKQHGRHAWTKVADLLQTNRSPFVCLQRFQTKLNPDHQKKWTDKDEGKLKRIVKKYDKQNVPWKQVALQMGGLTAQECESKWNKCNIHKSWPPELDQRLKEAVELYGQDWCKVRAHIPGKNHVQCRERWVNTLNNSIKFGKWTSQEDELLWRGVHQMGLKGNWSRLARELLPNRTDNQILNRFKRLSTWASAVSYNDTSQVPKAPRTQKRGGDKTVAPARKKMKMSKKEDDENSLIEELEIGEEEEDEEEDLTCVNDDDEFEVRNVTVDADSEHKNEYNLRKRVQQKRYKDYICASEYTEEEDEDLDEIIQKISASQTTNNKKYGTENHLDDTTQSTHRLDVENQSSTTHQSDVSNVFDTSIQSNVSSSTEGFKKKRGRPKKIKDAVVLADNQDNNKKDKDVIRNVRSSGRNKVFTTQHTDTITADNNIYTTKENGISRKNTASTKSYDNNNNSVDINDNDKNNISNNSSNNTPINRSVNKKKVRLRKMKANDENKTMRIPINNRRNGTLNKSTELPINTNKENNNSINKNKIHTVINKNRVGLVGVRNNHHINICTNGNNTSNNNINNKNKGNENALHNGDVEGNHDQMLGKKIHVDCNTHTTVITISDINKSIKNNKNNDDVDCDDNIIYNNNKSNNNIKNNKKISASKYKVNKTGTIVANNNRNNKNKNKSKISFKITMI